MDQVIWSEKEVVAYYKIISFNLTAGAVHADSIKHWVVSYKIETIFTMIVVTITGIFMAINYLLIYTLGFLYISNSGSADAQLPGCFCPWTFSLNIGLNMFLGLLYVMFTYPTRIFYRGVPGFATDCPCGVWCRGLPTSPLYVGPLFGNLV